jgi:hypothetical protein
LPIGNIPAEQLKFNASLQKIILLNTQFRYAESIEIARKLLSYKLNPNSLHTRIILLYMYAAALVFSGQGEKALLPLREILKGNKTARLDMQLNAMLLELIIQYDLGNYSVISYSIQSIKKWMSRKGQDPEGALPYLKWILRITEAAASGNERKELQAFLEDVKQGKIKIDTGRMNIKYWLEQKLRL